MDIHGWVPVEVVCGFRRVRQLSIDEEAVIQVIAVICDSGCKVNYWLCLQHRMKEKLNRWRTKVKLY